MDHSSMAFLSWDLIEKKKKEKKKMFYAEPDWVI